MVGNVTYATILAGYDVNGRPLDGSAQIGNIFVEGDWIASSAVAGAQVGASGVFGTPDNTRIPGGTPGIHSEIARGTEMDPRPKPKEVTGERPSLPY